MTVELSKVPQEIREQFGSEQTSTLVADICKKMDISNVRSISRLLFLLETKGLPAHDLTQSIVRDAKVTEGEAKTIAKEIKGRVLEPMRYALFQWGIDISDIKVHDASPLEELEPNEIKKEERNITVEDIGKEEEIKEESISITPITLSEKPFILHQEKSQAPEEKKSSFKGFSMPFGFFKSKNQPAPAGKSTKVEIETSGDSPKNEKRTVNYNELRTSLSPFEVEQNFINPVKNEPVSALIVPIPEIKPVPAAPEIPPLSEEKKSEIFGTIKKPQPKVEGNTIDLR